MEYDLLAQERELAFALATLLRLRYSKQRESSSDLMLSFLIYLRTLNLSTPATEPFFEISLCLRPVMPTLIVPGKRLVLFFDLSSEKIRVKEERQVS